MKTINYQQLVKQLQIIEDAFHEVYPHWSYQYEGVQTNGDTIVVYGDYSEDWYREIEHTLTEEEFFYSKEELVLKFQSDIQEKAEAEELKKQEKLAKEKAEAEAKEKKLYEQLKAKYENESIHAREHTNVKVKTSVEEYINNNGK
jgi:hypothetical protein